MDGDPLRYGTAMIWAPVKSIYWGTKKPLLLTTPTVILHCFSPETQKRGWVVVSVSKRLKEAALWRGLMSQATGKHPRIPQVICIVGHRPSPGLPEPVVMATGLHRVSFGEALGGGCSAH